jgi:hypothetical protein
MKNELQRASQGFDLGVWLGRREAYGSVAEACSAAEAACLREVREKNLFISHARNWDEFCTKHLGVSRRTVDKQIGYLQELGASYFDLAQLAKIGPETFRAIRQHVSDDGIEVDGRTVALLPENREEVKAAVETLRKRVTASKPPFELTLERCETAAKQLDKQAYGLDTGQKLALAKVLGHMRNTACRLGVTLAEGFPT